MTAPPPPEDSPRTLAGAAALGGAHLLRDLLLNGGVLFSLIVGVGGAISGEQPWQWLGPVIGVLGIVASFAGHRERIVTTATGERRRTMLPSPATWAVAVGVPLLCLATMRAMWT